MLSLMVPQYSVDSFLALKSSIVQKSNDAGSCALDAVIPTRSRLEVWSFSDNDPVACSWV